MASNLGPLQLVWTWYEGCVELVVKDVESIWEKSKLEFTNDDQRRFVQTQMTETMIEWMEKYKIKSLTCVWNGDCG